MSEFTLKKHPSFSPRKGPVVICVMDGVGVAPECDGNAVRLARTPNLDWLKANCPFTTLRAHGTAVGMPSDDDMGNSEVGHNALGAGRVFDQGSKLVGRAIQNGDLFRGETWRSFVAQATSKHSAMHFIGLLSDGNVHSHIDHLVALLRRADAEGVEKAFVHVLLDGRDVPETSAFQYVDALEAVLSEISAKPSRCYRIASGGGRMLVTMDRYNANWSVVKRGWDAHVNGVGRPFPSVRAAIETYRTETPGTIDQNLPEFVITDNGKPVGTMNDGDVVVLFNFRGDRAIEISRAFDDDEFAFFDRGRRPNVAYAGMMQYDGDLAIPKKFLVAPPAIERTVGEFLARNGLKQFAASETQKFGHVTYFWNGNRSEKFDQDLETYVCVPSDLRPFDERPWMKAAEVTDAFIEAMESGQYKHMRLNYANGDMVGHTGVLQATIQGVEAVDLCLGRLIRAVRKAGGILLVTADHGNADEMYELDKKGKISLDKKGSPKAKTAHTLNPVPFAIFDPEFAGEYQLAGVERAGLSNIAATLLNLMGFEAPADFDQSLISFK
jgi:2,3-bisphosphoglycerate-independent phosphoglycerate mutase